MEPNVICINCGTPQASIQNIQKRQQ